MPRDGVLIPRREAGRRTVVMDLETTGLSPQRGDRVIEIGAVSCTKGVISGEFHSLINPSIRITSGARNTHGITDGMLAGKPKPEVVLWDFHRFIGNSVLVAHNASFDLTFLRYEFGRCGLSFSNPYHCTLAMSRKRYPQLRDHKLETVYSHLFGTLPEGVVPHRALDDAKMVARVWMEMVKISV